MARDFFINGPTIVKVKGGLHMSGRPIGTLTELGLTSESIRVEPRFFHQDITPDDYGKNVPAETLWDLADAKIHMTLVHYDWFAVEACLMQAMGGGAVSFSDGPTLVPFRGPAFGGTAFPVSRMAGGFATGGRLMGGGLPMFASGNYYISLNVTSRVDPLLDTDDRPWRFRSCYLAEQPVVYPLGTKYSAVELVWRAIPYAPIWVSGRFQATNEPNAPAYNRPPGTRQLSGPDTVTRVITIDPTAFADFIPFYLTGEILSSGITLWDRVEDT